MRRTPRRLSMRLSLRFLVPLLIALGLFAYAAVPLVDSLTTRWFVRDLDMRRNLIANTVQEPLEELIRAGSPARILGFFTRLTRTSASTRSACACDQTASPIATAAFPGELRCCDARAATRRRRRTCCAPRAAWCTSRCARSTSDTPTGARTGARARHELRRAAQRGDAPLPVLLLRRARRRASRSSPS